MQAAAQAKARGAAPKECVVAAKAAVAAANDRHARRKAKAQKKAEVRMVERERRKLAVRQVELEKQGVAPDVALKRVALERGVTGMSYHELLAHKKGGKPAVTAQHVVLARKAGGEAMLRLAEQGRLSAMAQDKRV